MNMSDIYLNSLFSGVAYANKTGDHTITSELNSQTLLKQFTDNPNTVYDEQAMDENRFLVSDFSTTSAPSSSGFAAAVVQDRATNQVTIAFRGTEDGWIQPDYGADLQILVTGTAQKQIVDMYNYVSRVTARAGAVVNQYAFTTTSTPPPVGTRYTEVGIDSLGGPIYEYLAVTGTVSGLGLVPNGATVNFTGHSLGGHLALAASRLFSGLSGQVYTYNAPGFRGAGVDAFFNFFPNAASAFPTSQTQNIYANDPPSFVSSRDLFNYPGVDVPVAGEGRGTDSHRINPLQESLAVYGLLSKLDPTLTMAQMETIIRSATNNTDSKLEATIDSLRAAAKGGAVTPTAPGRESLLSAISNDPLLNLLPAGGLNIISIANLNVSALASLALQEASVFLALQRLSPIALGGYTPPAESADAAAKALWQQDRAGTLEGQNFTSEYLADKAKMLSGILTLAKNDLNPGTDAASSTDYRDLGTGKQLGACLGQINPLVTFGSAGAEMLSGSSSSDRLYGGAGSDSLSGGAGNDYLEGGMGADVLQGGAGNDTLVGLDDGTVDTLRGGIGFDTYYAGAGDVIIDEDGVGVVYVGKEKIHRWQRLGGSIPPPVPGTNPVQSNTAQEA